MVVGIHQPNYFPWMGYFDKMDNADVFILLDDVITTGATLKEGVKVLKKHGAIEIKILTLAKSYI